MLLLRSGSPSDRESTSEKSDQRDNDIAGIAVHMAQRICNAAQPGETLVFRTVTDLVAGSGIDFEDRGDFELKGVTGSYNLFAATG